MSPVCRLRSSDAEAGLGLNDEFAAQPEASLMNELQCAFALLVWAFPHSARLELFAEEDLREL